MEAHDWLTFINAVGSLGVITWLMLLLRWYWNRRRWRAFAKRIDQSGELPFDREELRLWTIHWLYECEFSAQETRDLLETMTTFAEARIYRLTRFEIDDE